MSNILCGMFLSATSAIVGTLAFIDIAMPNMGWVVLGCVACFVGGWALIAEEFING